MVTGQKYLHRIEVLGLDPLGQVVCVWVTVDTSMLSSKSSTISSSCGKSLPK